MPTQTFDIGDVPRLPVKVKDYDGNLVDPGSIKLIVDPPGATSVEFAGSAPAYTPIVRVSLGSFYCLVDLLTVEGAYEFRWETDSPKGAEQGRFFVRKKNVVPP